MSGSNAPDFDTYGLLRATHSHVSAPLRSVLDMCHWHIAPYPIFAYRGIIIPLLCSYRGGSKGLSPTYEQAHVGLDLLTLVSSKSEDSTSFYVVLRKEAELMDDVRRAGFVNVAKCVGEGAEEDETDIGGSEKGSDPVLFQNPVACAAGSHVLRTDL